MILKEIARVDRLALKFMRECSYKAIKRPNFNSTSKRILKEKESIDISLQQILQAKIEFSGPITGKWHQTITVKWVNKIN